MITPMHWELSRVLPGLKSADTYQGIRIIRSEVGPQYKIGGARECHFDNQEQLVEAAVWRANAR